MLFSQAFAAWTIAVTIDKDQPWKAGQRMYRVKVAGVSDGSDPAEFNLSTYLSSGWDGDMAKIKGGLFYMVETDPGTAPDAVWAVSFDSDLGANILDLSGLSVTETEMHDGANDLGFAPAVFDVGVDIGDIGSASDSVDSYIYILK
jgi:hypothetical protein